MESDIKFRHVVIDENPPGAHHDILLLADLTKNGLPDVIIGGKLGDVNLFWYENPGWKRHSIAVAPNLEAGGWVADIAGNGRPDIVAGQSGGALSKELYWFECPEDPTRPWVKHLIVDRYKKYHDQIVADINGDGKPEVIFISQKAGVLCICEIPPDPRVSPWPEQYIHVAAEGIFDVEGLAVVDIDGDGRLEIVTGMHIFHAQGDPLNEPWRIETYAGDYTMARVAVADLDGDGKLDIVLAEGESNPARLAWQSGSDGVKRLLRDDLFHPHSLCIGDFDGDGRPDIFVGEMGLDKNPDPKLLLYLNQGGGQFRETIIHRGLSTHEAKIADMTGDGRLDIVGKPFDLNGGRIDLWLNEGR